MHWQAVKQQIMWEELVDLIDLAFATYNAEPTAGLGQRSPLDLLRDCFNPLATRCNLACQFRLR